SFHPPQQVLCLCPKASRRSCCRFLRAADRAFTSACPSRISWELGRSRRRVQEGERDPARRRRPRVGRRLSQRDCAGCQGSTQGKQETPCHCPLSGFHSSAASPLLRNAAPLRPRSRAHRKRRSCAFLEIHRKKWRVTMTVYQPASKSRGRIVGTGHKVRYQAPVPATPQPGFQPVFHYEAPKFFIVACMLVLPEFEKACR